MAWLERFSPTPGRSARTSMPSARRSPAGPMPDRSRNAGECTPPTERMISRALNSLFLATDPRADAGDAAALEHEAGRHRPVDDGQVAARAHRGVEIADRRRRALVRPVAHRHRAVAVAEIRVHVGDERESGARARRRRPPSTAAPSPPAWCGGSAPARRGRAIRRRSPGRARACGKRAARRSSPSRPPRALPIRRSRRAFRDTPPCPSPRSRRP